MTEEILRDDPDLRAAAREAHDAVREFEQEVARVYGERGQRETSELLGVAHTTALRWGQGILSAKLGNVVDRLGELQKAGRLKAKVAQVVVVPREVRVRDARPVVVDRGPPESPREAPNPAQDLF